MKITKYPHTITYGRKRKVKISVVICTVNRLKEIQNCLNSLEKQSFMDFEVIVVDGRKDEKLDSVCKKVSKQLFIKRVKIDKWNLAYSRNTAIDVISSPVAAFIDDDAMAADEWARNIYYYFQNNKNIVGLGGKILSANNNYLSKFAEKLFDYGNVPKKLLTITGTNMSLNVGRIRKFKSFRREIFNETFNFAGEETEACFNINIAGGKLLFEPEIVVRHEFETGFARFVKKHFSYGVGDYNISQIPKYKKFNLIKLYNLRVNRNLSKLLLPFIIPLVVLYKNIKFIRTYGLVWFPLSVVREWSYALGIYYALLTSSTL